MKQLLKRFIKTEWLRFVIQWALIVAIIFGGVSILFNTVITNQQIFGPSMQPNFNAGDRVFGNQLAKPARGDVVIVKAPDENGQNWYIKRIVGMPGDTLQSVDDTMLVNNKPLAENYLEAYKQKLKPGDQLTKDFTLKQVTGVKRVPKGNYFVMGDNRRISRDSRKFGFVTRDDIRGIVFFKYWPLNDIAFY